MVSSNIMVLNRIVWK